MVENLYMAIGDGEPGPDVGPFRRCMNETVHPVALQAGDDLGKFLSLLGKKYIAGIFIPDGKLARLASDYGRYTMTPTLYADTLIGTWGDCDVKGFDSAYVAMCDLLLPATFGRTKVMSAVLGTGRMASAAVAALYPMCIYLNVVCRMNSPRLDALDSVVEGIAGMSGKVTCAVEYTYYDTVALDTMDIVVNTTPVPLAELVPGFSPRLGQYVLDIAEDSGNRFRMAWYEKVMTGWLNPSTMQYLAWRSNLDEYFNGCQ